MILNDKCYNIWTILLQYATLPTIHLSYLLPMEHFSNFTSLADVHLGFQKLYNKTF